MKPPIAPPEKGCQIRCSRLGHQIHFTYCRTENMGAPCGRILDCWHPYFPVAEYLRQELSSAEWEETFVKPAKPRIVSLMELIDQAGKRAQQARK